MVGFGVSVDEGVELEVVSGSSSVVGVASDAEGVSTAPVRSCPFGVSIVGCEVGTVQELTEKINKVIKIVLRNLTIILYLPILHRL